MLYVLSRDLAVGSLGKFIFGNAVFFALGIWFNEIKAYFLARHVPLTLLLGASFVIGQYLFHVTFGLNWEVGGWPVLSLAAVSILFVVALSMWLGRLRMAWLLFIGASSMTIYLMHILAGSGIRVILASFMGIDSIAVHLIVGTLVGLAAPLLAQMIIKKYDLYFLLAPPKSFSATSLRTRAMAH